MSFFKEAKQLTVDQKLKIQQMKQAGQSYAKIAKVLVISENTIKSHCRRNNIRALKGSKETEKTKKTYTLCKQCKKPLLNKTKGQPKKFCSDECRRLWWKNNDNKIHKKAYYTIPCVGCGKEFESYGNPNRKYCGHACYIKHRFNRSCY